MAVIAQVAGYEESKEEFQRVSGVRVLVDLLDVVKNGYGGGRWGGEGGVGALRDVPENGSGKWDLGLGWYGSGEWDMSLRWYLVDFSRGFVSDSSGDKKETLAPLVFFGTTGTMLDIIMGITVKENMQNAKRSY
ncbi:hypothetical protein C1H46_025271 [Malus baccata]|uniref:Uncharacterized protein n=1 Tax=Malus baccata TaxID=106549 RepID=A0A540LRX8_MALBA|nr:hypothetical protein C1H46_025271 [Malus baccata]